MREIPFDVVDMTNQPNDWQGTLRFALLDVATLGDRVRVDLSDAVGGAVRVRPALAMSCLDQALGDVVFAEHGVERAASGNDFAAVAAEVVGAARLDGRVGSEAP